jgi:hypothetical protein
MKKKSVITPPPIIDEGQGIEGNLALTEEEREQGLLKLIRKGAPSTPIESEDEKIDERTRFTFRISKSILERVTKCQRRRENVRRIAV